MAAVYSTALLVAGTVAAAQLYMQKNAVVRVQAPGAADSQPRVSGPAPRFGQARLELPASVAPAPLTGLPSAARSQPHADTGFSYYYPRFGMMQDGGVYLSQEDAEHHRAVVRALDRQAPSNPLLDPHYRRVPGRGEAQQIS